MNIFPLSRLAGVGALTLLLLSSIPASAEEEWTTVLADGKLASIVKDSAPPGTGWEQAGDKVLTFDRGTDEGSFFYISYPLDFQESKTLVAEVRGQMVSGMNGIMISSEHTVVGLRLFPGEITWRDQKKRAAVNTGDAMHTYRITMSAGQVRVELDGSTLFEGPPVDKKEPDNKARLSFGSGNSSSTGEALWESVRFRFE